MSEIVFVFVYEFSVDSYLILFFCFINFSCKTSSIILLIRKLKTDYKFYFLKNAIIDSSLFSLQPLNMQLRKCEWAEAANGPYKF